MMHGGGNSTVVLYLHGWHHCAVADAYVAGVDGYNLDSVGGGRMGAFGCTNFESQRYVGEDVGAGGNVRVVGYYTCECDDG